MNPLLYFKVLLLIERVGIVPKTNKNFHKVRAADRGRGWPPVPGTPPIGNPQNVIDVPDLDAVDLTALTKLHCDLSFLDRDYAGWDFYHGVDGKPISGRGKRFEFMTWDPGREVGSDVVHAYFEELGFYGHAGAFTAFVKQRKPVGSYASIPDDNACWRFSDGRRELRHEWINLGWADRLVFVAFREL